MNAAEDSMDPGASFLRRKGASRRADAGTTRLHINNRGCELFHLSGRFRQDSRPETGAIPVGRGKGRADCRARRGAREGSSSVPAPGARQPFLRSSRNQTPPVFDAAQES
jgi:hypothetical protein